jgi:hypothetical protein
MKRCFIALLFTLIVLKAQSQELLNASKDKIEKDMASKGATLTGDQKGRTADLAPYDIMVYDFHQPIVQSNDILKITFLVKNDKCYEYYFRYRSDRYLQTLVKKFDNSKSGFKRDGKNLKWVNAKGDRIRIAATSRNVEKILAFEVIICTKIGV